MSAQHGAHAFPKRLVQGKGREHTRHESKNKLPITARAQWRELDFQVRGEEEKVTEGNCVKQTEWNKKKVKSDTERHLQYSFLC